jgi:hypothetical protein
LGRDKYEHEKPRILFNTSQILFCRPDWNSSYPYFDADFRNAVGEGQVWQFEVFNPSRSKSSIVFEGLEKIPTSYQIAVLNLTTMKMESIRESTRIEFQPASETTIFRLLVGYPSFVERQLDENVPATFALHQNYPNPFNPATTIKYDLPVACQVSLTIYSILGREVATVVDGWQEKGYKSFEWSAQSLSTGMYFYRLKAGEYTAVRKMVVLK